MYIGIQHDFYVMCCSCCQ